MARCNGAPLTDNLQGPSLPLLAPCQPCCPSGVAAFVFVSLERSSAFAASGSWVCPSARLAARKPALSLWANWLYLLSLLCRAGVCLCCCCFAYRFRAGVLFLCLPSSQGLPRFPLEPKQGWAVILGTDRDFGMQPEEAQAAKCTRPWDAREGRRCAVGFCRQGCCCLQPRRLPAGARLRNLCSVLVLPGRRAAGCQPWQRVILADLCFSSQIQLLKTLPIFAILFFLHSFLLAESSCDFFFLWVVFFSPQKIRVIHAALPCPGYPLAPCILHAQEAKKSKVECLCAEPSSSTALCPWLSGAHGASYHENQDLRSPAKG